MTPKSHTICKFDANEDKTDEVINSLKTLIFEDKKCISYTNLSLRFGVHVKQAIEILDKFVAEHRTDGQKFAVNYVLSGNNDNSDNNNEIKMERFMIVDESEINSSNDWYKNGFNKHIYSVGFNEDNNEIDLNFDYDYEVNDKNDLNNLQNLTYIKNENIDFRKVNRRVGIKPVVPKEEVKTEQIKSNTNDKKETETKSKPKSNSKNTSKSGKKNNKVSNMFTKVKTDVKVEDEDKDSEDPFKSDSEDESKPVVDIQDSPTVEAVEEEIIEEVKEEKLKKQCKRQSENSDEEVISNKKKHKKYKRVRIISESDSEPEVEEKKAIDKYVAKREPKSRIEDKKIEQKQESYVDEDGYTVTRIVKIEVTNGKEDNKVPNEDKNASKEDKSVSKEDKKVAEEDNEEEEDDKNELSKKNESADKKTKQKIKKIADKKPPKDTKVQKNQSSITSFFKPKQIST